MHWLRVQKQLASFSKLCSLKATCKPLNANFTFNCRRNYALSSRLSFACHQSSINHGKSLIQSVLVVGSGGLSIGQAGEFDYSGSQAIKALKESQVRTILVNPNIATIQTSHHLADEVYYLPSTPEYVAHIIDRERPDAILLTFGGQTALNIGIALDKMGIFDHYNVKVLGTPISTLIATEDRDLFAQALQEIDIPIAKSTAVESIDAALEAAESIGYPIIVRSAFSLGGLGSGFANNPEELRSLAAQSLSLSSQILVEKSMKGWKEVEYEVVRDAKNNCITVCNMENFDPLGVHTGDSIVVAPSQTLSDEEYHMLRSAAIKIVRHLGVVGECNVQYALAPNGLDYCVIEVNARLSRSSALASKATGYPLAYTAAKIALGHSLPELPNAVTGNTTANFEPSLDYIVTKIPRWDLAKFQHVSRKIGSGMKSVGEVMAIGRTFEESLQKAIRQVDPAFLGFAPLSNWKMEDLDYELSNPTDRRLFAVAKSMIEENYSVDKLHEITKIDKWFLYKLQNIKNIRQELQSISGVENIPQELFAKAKKSGFSDVQIAELIQKDPEFSKLSKLKQQLAIRDRRKKLKILPVVKKIDTLAAEFPAATNYLYTTYNGQTSDVNFDDKGVVVLGSGVYRIGSSVEFDWCGVSCVRSLRAAGIKTVMVNYNPETVSTDYDESERLYFEELSLERVLDIIDAEDAQGVIVSVGGQLPQNIALSLQEAGVRVLGTDPRNVDMAEDRHKFSKILDEIGVGQPEWSELRSTDQAREFAKKVGFPVLVRPSYVLSGAAMSVIHDESTLKDKLENACSVSPEHPVVITKFIEGAKEIDVDAVAHKGKLLVHSVCEHIEEAGVHSGDATLVLPPVSLSQTVIDACKKIAMSVADGFEISGPFNMQIIYSPKPNETDPDLKVIECNLRASRSFPFVSKVLGVNFVEVATKAITGKDVPVPQDLMAIKRDYVAVKVPQFSWTRLGGADPSLGVEMSSTGEVACFGKTIYDAYWHSLQSVQGFKIPSQGSTILVGGDQNEKLFNVVTLLKSLQYNIVVTDETMLKFLEDKSLKSSGLNSASIIKFPADDKNALRKVIEENNIQLVINLTKAKSEGTHDLNYLMRRSAVDFGIPLFNDANCALLFAQTLQNQVGNHIAQCKIPLSEREIPVGVKRWSEYTENRTI